MERQIWEQNLEYAAVIEEILQSKIPYSYESLESLLGDVVKYLRITGHKLENYDRKLKIYGELFTKMP